MVLGALIGTGIGLTGGVTAGWLLFGTKETTEFRHLDIEADADDTVEEPKCGAPISNDTRRVLELSPAWTKWPDYERVAWLNKMIAGLWPQYNKAIADIVDDTVKPILGDIVKGLTFVDSIEIENLDLGNKPMKIGGLKTYDTQEDEVILEAPILWGSNANIRVSACLRVGPVAIYVPVEVRDIQLHAVARVTIRPLVETLPCLGAVHISLLNPPHVDMGVMLINKIDLMALPGVRELVNSIIQSVIGSMMLYPNQFSVDLMEGGGLASPPVGMLQVELKKVEGLKNVDTFSKNDTYALMEVREGRPQRSKTMKGTTVEFDDDPFYFIVDDVESQSLKITVLDDDFGFSDKVLGVATRPLEDEVYITETGPKDVVYNIYKEKQNSVTRSTVRKLASTLTRKPKDEAKAVPQGKVTLRVSYYPFFRPESGDEGDEEGEAAPNRHLQFSRMKTMTNVRDDMKGVLSVTLTRCTNLTGGNAYVQFSLKDKVADTSAERKSTVVRNDSSPRWGDTFDFVMINALSILTVTVNDKSGFLQSVVKLGKKSEDKDAFIGKVQIPVRDVVRNGRLKDVWALQEVQQGEISLTLTWSPVEIAV